MPVIVFDTETTGVYNFKLEALNPKQPRMVSLGAMMFSDDLHDEIGQFYAIVRPDDFVIPEDATRKHGISHDFALKNGIDGLGVVHSFLRLFLECRLGVAFNSQFDFHIIASEILRRCPSMVNLFPKSKMRCAMLAASSCMKLPNQYGYENYAWPKLVEAYKWMFNQEMEGAHHALMDVRATAYLTRGMVQLNYWDLDADRVLI